MAHVLVPDGSMHLLVDTGVAHVMPLPHRRAVFATSDRNMVTCGICKTLIKRFERREKLGEGDQL